tara:strand:- start:3312 stop:4382 length:1071 start_codon:yes stop_codon:yes gene_type:complete
MNYEDVQKKRKLVLSFIRKNPKATYKDIRKETKLHPERLFEKGMAEAFEEAGIKPPRTFTTKSIDEKKKILIDYVRKNPRAGGQKISKDTKINFLRLFKSTKNLFLAAGILYPRDERRKLILRKDADRRAEIIKLVRENPLITITELMKETRISPYKIFDTFSEIYEAAGLDPIVKTGKWAEKKKNIVVDFIKENPTATQREININCNTHVQRIFAKGIFEAYEKAGVNYPFERLKLYGTARKEIKDRAEKFEQEVASKLSGFGNVNRLVKTKRGFADIILERKGKKYVVEVKDYQAKEISISQIKQLNKYLQDLECDTGILICRNKPRKDRFLMGENRIFILDDSEIRELPNLID